MEATLTKGGMMKASQRTDAPTEEHSVCQSGTGRPDALEKREIVDAVAKEDRQSEYVSVRGR
jgi:hypothetical protein